MTTIILAALRGYKPMYWRYNPARCHAIDRNHLFEPDQCCGKYPDRNVLKIMKCIAKLENKSSIFLIQ